MRYRQNLPLPHLCYYQAPPQQFFPPPQYHQPPLYTINNNNGGMHVRMQQAQTQRTWEMGRRPQLPSTATAIWTGTQAEKLWRGTTKLLRGTVAFNGPTHTNMTKTFKSMNSLWSCGYDLEDNHTSTTCPNPQTGHIYYATHDNPCNGCQKSCHKTNM